MSLHPIHVRRLAALLTIALLTWGLNANAQYTSDTGTFMVYAAGTSDSNWGYCSDREYNSSHGRYDLYTEPCTAPANPESGWNLTATQNFHIETNGLIEALSADAGANLGCLDLLDNNVDAGAEIDIDPPTADGGCNDTNEAQEWEFQNGAIILGENEDFCIQENGSGNPMTLQSCTGDYNQVFVPVNMSSLFASAVDNNVYLSFVGSNGACEGAYPLFSVEFVTLGNQLMFQFQPSNQPYYHAIIAGQQDVSGAPVADPVGLLGCGGTCIYGPGDWDYMPTGGAYTCADAGNLGNAFPSSVTSGYYAYQYTGTTIVNSVFMDAGDNGVITLPTCVTASATNGEAAYASICTDDPPAAAQWTLNLVDFPSPR